jgi:transcriptional regulator with XRE-family HTH domain
MSKGYSVNRLASEADRLSPDAIMRLESGGVVTTVTLYRYADVLGVTVKKLFDFSFVDEETNEALTLRAADKDE